MMNKLGIHHRDEYKSITFREDFFQICDGNIIQALILSILETRIDENDSEVIYTPMNHKEFIYELFSQYTRQTTHAAVDQLLKKDLIERRPHTEESVEYVYDYRIKLATVQEKLDQLPPKAKRESPNIPEFISDISGRHRAVWNTFGGLCAYCRVVRATTWDHIIPRSKNGRDIKSNIVPACRQCNMLKKDKDVQEWMDASGITPSTSLVKIINEIKATNSVDEEADGE